MYSTASIQHPGELRISEEIACGDRRMGFEHYNYRLSNQVLLPGQLPCRSVLWLLRYKVRHTCSIGMSLRGGRDPPLISAAVNASPSAW